MMMQSDSRNYILTLLTIINVAAFWHRNLLYNLTAVSLEECSSDCSGSTFAPMCQKCTDLLASSEGQDAVDSCEACQQCRNSHDSSYYLIQDGVCFDNFQFGILAGVGFTIMFSVCGIGVGRLADLMDRRRLLVFACLLWSAATGAFSVCNSFSAMLIARVVMGIGQAFNAPCAYPIIASLFSEETRSTANGIYAVGTYVGSALSSLSIGIAIAFGWQTTSLLAGLAGIVSALALYRTTDSVASGISASTACRLTTGVQPPWIPPDPDEEDELGKLLPSPSTSPVTIGSPVSSTPNTLREANDSQKQDASSRPTLMENMTMLIQNKPVMLLYGATSMRMTATYAAAAYFPVYYTRAFPADTTYFSITHAFCILGGGGISAYLGGRVADRYGPRRPSVLASLPGAGGLLAVLPLTVACFTDNFRFAMIMLAVQYLCAECWLGPGMTLLQLLLRVYQDREIMSTAVALLLFVNTMVASVAPSMIAYWDNGTADSVRWGVFTAIASSYVLSAVFFGLLAVSESLPMPQGEEEKSGKPLFGHGQAQPPVYTVLNPTSTSALAPISNATNIPSNTGKQQLQLSPSRRQLQLHEV